ncbi:TolC family outer membrane protein [Endozoicomonadaceae bacterium StTr2]
MKPRALSAFCLPLALMISTTAHAASLEETIRMALQTNPTVLAEQHRLSASEASTSAALGGYFPSLDVAAGIGSQRKEGDRNSNLPKKQRTRKETSVSLNQMLFDGFSVSSSVAEASYAEQAQLYSLQSATENMALQIAQVYIRVLENQDLVAMAEKNLEVHDSIYEQVKLRTDQGIARSSDLAQIEGRKARANANLINARNNLEDAISAFYAVVNTLPEELTQPGSDSFEMPETLEAAITTALSNNPRLKSEEARIRAAEESYEGRKSSFFPQFNIEIQKSWNTDADGVAGTDEDLTAMVRMRYNLFRGGSDRARLKESAWQAEQSRSDRDRQVRTVTEDVKVAWAARNYIKQQLEYLKVHLDSSSATVDAYREQFNIGKRTLLDLLDSENELFQSQRTFITAQYDLAEARFRILAHIGMLLKTMKLETNSTELTTN